MKLNLEQIKAITLGASYIDETEKGINFHRFTREQEELYKVRSAGFYQKCFGPSGVRLSFETDSTTLGFSVDISVSSTRKYFSFDLFVDGKYRESLENYSDKEIPVHYVKAEFPQGHFDKTFALGEGRKSVVLLFPWSVCVDLCSVTLDDGADIVPVKPQKKLLAYGDSITHGYDAMLTSNRYIGKLADALGAEEYNKAIGGEIFFPELAALDEVFTPDYITAAYGTNDWSKNKSIDVLRENCTRFYSTLAEKYPNAKIFALTPIWRGDIDRVNDVGSYADVVNVIAEAVKPYANITLIECEHVVPADTTLYADFRLHPNDKGFEHYFTNLYEKIKQYI